MPPAFCILFTGSSRVFAVEQFGIWHWKANEYNDKNKIKSGRLQPGISRNMFEQIQIVKKIRNESKHKCYTTRATILRQVLQSQILSLCRCFYFVMNLNISVIPTELQSCGKQQNLGRVGHSVLFRSVSYVLFHSKKRTFRSFQFFSRVFGDL